MSWALLGATTAQAEEHPEDEAASAELHASEPEAPSAVVTDCNARSIDGCLCMGEKKAISLIAEVKACRRLQPEGGGSSGWIVGLLALVGALLGNLARGAFGL